MATAAELIAAAEAAETTKELDDIESLAEGRVTVLEAISDARARLTSNGEIVAEGTPQTPIPVPNDGDWYGHSTPPDFVWVGCGNCWTPKDLMRPVLAYSVWQADGHRYLTYVCQGCQLEVHSAQWAMWIEDAHPWSEGAIAATATEVQRWGS